MNLETDYDAAQMRDLTWRQILCPFKLLSLLLHLIILHAHQENLSHDNTNTTTTSSGCFSLLCLIMAFTHVHMLFPSARARRWPLRSLIARTIVRGWWADIVRFASVTTFSFTLTVNCKSHLGERCRNIRTTFRVSSDEL